MSRPVICLIGIDGLRLDVAQEPETAPSLQRFFTEGSWTELEMEVPTLSGPGWSTILTGSPHSRHGVFDNTFHGNRLAHCPDFLSRAYYADTSAGTYAASSWAPLTDPAGPGPVIATRADQRAAGRHAVVVRDGEVYGYRVADAEVARYSLMVFGEVSPTATFVYLGEVDEAGHLYGVGDEYRDAARRADSWLGALVTQIERCATDRDEDWLVGVVTDHGHLDEGGHGGDQPVVRRSFFTTLRFTPGNLGTPELPPLAPEGIADYLLSHLH